MNFVHPPPPSFRRGLPEGSWVCLKILGSLLGFLGFAFKENPKAVSPKRTGPCCPTSWGLWFTAVDPSESPSLAERVALDKAGSFVDNFDPWILKQAPDFRCYEPETFWGLHIFPTAVTFRLICFLVRLGNARTGSSRCMSSSLGSRSRSRKSAASPSFPVQWQM